MVQDGDSKRLPDTTRSYLGFEVQEFLKAGVAVLLTGKTHSVNFGEDEFKDHQLVQGICILVPFDGLEKFAS